LKFITLIFKTLYPILKSIVTIVESGVKHHQTNKNIQAYCWKWR